ncbi:uncharacterized protein Bfra_005044 [Botrytis fragariae]|uniref:ABM domain-containing protein n=1 Tax=Botrytis fragariae TaxID=1964551 RepID=A0A8H6ATN7_9HELO|nr:uncharacterized protein Bfra_005044 [Botrytis fragariae]KAF5873581.1 hypothetical protein Bfra_005044 [Botrytis fragariae]
MNAPGFLRSRCARNVKNPEEVLFAIEWEDDASFKAFVESPADPLYIRGLGIHDSHIPNAMVSLFPNFDLVEKGVVLQAWPNQEPLVLYEAADQDDDARENGKRQVRRINPVSMEEITWHVAKVEEKDEED